MSPVGLIIKGIFPLLSLSAYFRRSVASPLQLRRPCSRREREVRGNQGISPIAETPLASCKRSCLPVLTDHDVSISARPAFI